MNIGSNGGVFLSLVIGLLVQSFSYAATAPPNNAASLVATVASGFSGGRPIGSIQLSGTAVRYSGPTSDSGPISLMAGADGSAQMSLTLSEGVLTESQTAAGVNRNCQWSGPDGTVHDSSASVCLLPLVWFIPQVMLQPSRSSPFVITQYDGLQPTSEGSFQVLQSQLALGASMRNAASAAQFQTRSTSLLFLDPSTLLPSLLDYTILSDSGTISIAVEVHYSNYQQLSGLMVPCRIERYLNGSLDLEIEISQVTVLN